MFDGRILSEFKSNSIPSKIVSLLPIVASLFNGQPLEGETVPKTGLKTYRYYDYNPNTKILTVYNN